MKFQTPTKVTIAAVAGLFSPDVLSAFFQRIGPVLDGLLRLGQFGVAIFTCLYIYRKWKALPKKKTKPRKTNGPLKR